MRTFFIDRVRHDRPVPGELGVADGDRAVRRERVRVEEELAGARQRSLSINDAKFVSFLMSSIIIFDVIKKFQLKLQTSGFEGPSCSSSNSRCRAWRCTRRTSGRRTPSVCHRNKS